MLPARAAFTGIAAPVLMAIGDDAPVAARIAEAAGGRTATIESRHFPDGETYLRLEHSLPAPDVAVVSTLTPPNARALELLLLASAAREWGAERVGLIAPYLPYMRQDAELEEGEAVTARSFAALISRSFDWLVTVDPHLHRIHELSELYVIPARSLHAAPAIGAWVRANVASPVIVGPDAESSQWVAAAARAANAPFMVLDKRRLGDTEVTISAAHLEAIGRRTPVLVDDVISSGRTMAAAVRILRASGHATVVCAAVHAIFAEGAHDALASAGASVVATTNTIPHVTNRIDLTALLARAITAGATQAPV